MNLIQKRKKTGVVKVCNGNKRYGLYTRMPYSGRQELSQILSLTHVKHFIIKPKERLSSFEKIFFLLLFSEDLLPVSQICMRLKLSAAVFRSFLCSWENGGIFYLIRAEKEQNRIMQYKIVSLNGTSNVLSEYVNQYKEMKEEAKVQNKIYALESIWNR